MSDPDRLGGMTALACALGASTIGTALGLRLPADILHGGLVNPDSAMRLVRLTDIVATGRPLHEVLRDGAAQGIAGGSVMSWSHLLDSLLLLIAGPLVPFLGWPGALHAAALAWSPLCMAGLGIAIGWAVLPLVGRSLAFIAAVAAGVSPPLLTYGLAGVVHHHVPIAICVIACAGWVLRLVRRQAPPVAGGVALGAWMTIGVWLSPETVPFALATLGALWLDWVCKATPVRSLSLFSSSATFALLTTCAWVVDPPATGLWAIEPDRLSLPFVALAAGAAVAALAARHLPRLVVLSFGSGLAAAWLIAFPQMMRGTEGLMSAEQAAAFFGPIQEMRAVAGAADVVAGLLPGLFALAVLLVLAWRRRTGRDCALLLYAAACTTGLLALAALHIRFSAYPAAAGAAMLPVALAAISRSVIPAILQASARLACLATTIVAPLFAPLVIPVAASAAATMPNNPLAAEICEPKTAYRLLADHPGAIVLASVNLTPDLLYHTQVRTIGSLYHRNPEGFMRLRAALRSRPGDAPADEVPPAVRATGATLMLACPHDGRLALLEDLPRDTMLDRVTDERPPAWLHRIADAGPGGYVLYRIAP